jgi:hypothetical protein
MTTSWGGIGSGGGKVAAALQFLLQHRRHGHDLYLTLLIGRSLGFLCIRTQLPQQDNQHLLTLLQLEAVFITFLLTWLLVGRQLRVPRRHRPLG